MTRYLAIVLLVACTGSDPEDTPQGLSLTVAEPGHLSGAYVDGELAVEFDVQRTETEVTMLIARDDGSELVSAVIPADGSDRPRELRVLDGQYAASLRGNQTLIAAATSTNELTGEDEEHDVYAKDTQLQQQAGDLDTFWSFVDSPHAAMIPMLSKALGDAGIDGQSYPASLPLHMMAIGISELTGIDPVEGVSHEVARYSHGWGSGVNFHHHYNNGYYAQCGPEGSCWSWACGDCGDWTGCGGHDADCHFCGSGEGGWYLPAACVNCAVPLEALSCGGWGHNVYNISCGHMYNG